MNRRTIKWITVIATILFLMAGTTWADGKQGRGPGKGDGKGYQNAPQKPGGHGRPVIYKNPPNFRPDPPRFQGRPAPSPHKGNVHGRPYVSPYHGHRGPGPAPRPPQPYHCHRPAPPVVHYYPAPPPPPQPFGGFLFSATISDPGFVFGIAIGDSW